MHFRYGDWEPPLNSSSSGPSTEHGYPPTDPPMGSRGNGSLVSSFSMLHDLKMLQAIFNSSSDSDGPTQALRCAVPLPLTDSLALPRPLTVSASHPAACAPASYWLTLFQPLTTSASNYLYRCLCFSLPLALPLTGYGGRCCNL